MSLYSLNEMEKDLNKLGWVYLKGRSMILIVDFIFSLISALLSSSGRLSVIESSYFINIRINISFLCLFLMLLFHYRKENILSKDIFNIEGIGLMTIIKAFIISYPIMMIGVYITDLIFTFLDLLGVTFVFDPEIFSSDNITSIATIVSTCLVAPILEESIFRGIILNILRKYGDKFAIITSALLFALIHGNIFQFSTAFTTGLWLGYLFIKTKSLTLTIVMHGLSNSLALSYVIFEIPVIINIAIKIGFGLIAIVIYFYSGKKYKLSKNVTLLEKSDTIFCRDKSIAKKQEKQYQSEIPLEITSPYECFYGQVPVRLFLMIDIAIIIIVTSFSTK
ncbi:CPBP family intramembrane metalloprotease [Tissierella pigra]|uniref:CPBP family intramembrane glutamic endopeptidase n=1 Tax=Tissierella pigra TaxID=2607614 RepID=UPI001C105278|nr:CPBP family intramembrane glutamic endopeptidase [Tissierella pigra]MBU5425875.1 CPBP family intramembrane metalloprotease [Tissierella pigra]